jgi:hypothetical protein
VSRQTIGVYFGTRDNLISAFLERALLQQIAGFAARVRADDDLRAGMCAAIAAELEVLGSLPAFNPPIRMDMLAFAHTPNNGVLQRQRHHTTAMLAELVGVEPSIAGAAGDVLSRLLFTYVADRSDRPVDEVAADIADVTLSLLVRDRRGAPLATPGG